MTFLKNLFKPKKSKQRKAYDLALEQVGLKELPGKEHEPKVVEFFADVGHSWVKDDETAWCAAFAGAMLKRAGLPHTGKLNARSYLKWGEKVDIQDVREGDVIVFTRGNPNGWQGHVAFFVGFNREGDIRVVGGNQSNSVNIATYSRERLLGVRRHKEEG